MNQRDGPFGTVGTCKKIQKGVTQARCGFTGTAWEFDPCVSIRKNLGLNLTASSSLSCIEKRNKAR